MRFSLFFGVVLAPFILSCKGNSNKPTTFITPVKVSRVVSLDYLKSSFPAVVKATESAALAFKVAGQVVDMNVTEGERVVSGYLIARIDPTEYKLSVESARALYIKSKSQYERFAKLVEKGAISEQEYEAIKAAYTLDKSNYDNAVITLNDTRLEAPFEGVIEQRFVDNYQRVQPSEPIVMLVNPALLEMQFTISEGQISLINAKDKSIYVEFETYPNQRFKAEVTKFVTSSTGGNYPVTVKINDSRFSLKEYNVKVGFTATVYVEVKQRGGTSEVAVPISSIGDISRGNTKFVWVYNPTTKKVERRNVVLGALVGVNEVVVTSGLSKNDIVVTAGVDKLVDNQEVKPLN